MASTSTSSPRNGEMERSMEKEEDQAVFVAQIISSPPDLDSTLIPLPVVSNIPPALGPEAQQQAADPLTSGSEILPLTKQNLRRLEKRSGSKKGSNTLSSGTSEHTSLTGGSENTSTTTHTDREFDAVLRGNGVFQPLDSLMPSNFDDLNSQLRRARASPPPSESSFRSFITMANESSNGAETTHLACHYVLKGLMSNSGRERLEQGYSRKLKKEWTSYPRDQGFNDGLPNPEPSYIEGYLREKFPPAIEDLGGSVTLDVNVYWFVALPHFAAELKSTWKSMAQTEYHARYNGAASE